MSLLRRKRRQNRLNEQLSPATRDARTSLEFEFPEFPTTRGLRTQKILCKLRLFPQREEKSLRQVIRINKPYNPFSLEANREVKHYDFIQKYNILRAKDAKNAVKSLSTIKPNGKVVVDLPPEHPICRQREERREILFATGKTGKGGQKPRQQDNNIKLRCK